VNLDVARQRLFSPRLYPILVAVLVLAVVGAFYVFGYRFGLRWIKLMIGMTVVVTLLSTRLSTGVGVFLLASVFPAYIVTGPTNFALAVLVTVSWLARSAMGGVARPSRTPCDLFLMGLTLAYALSWLNVPRDPDVMLAAWHHTQNHLGALMIFYVTYTAVEDERDLTTLTRFMLALAALIYVVALVEVVTGVSITGLGAVREARYTLGGGAVRAGGLLGSHDMLADFCSMNAPLQLFLFYRARRPALRFVVGLIALLGVVVLFMTSNRGGFVGYTLGVFYLALLLRRDLGTRAVAMGSMAVVGLFIVVDAILTQAGRTLSIFYRLQQTRFYGLLPETRVGVFEHFKSRIVENFWLGEGPFYRLSSRFPGEYVFWPHNSLAYYWATVGILGLVSYLGLCIQVIVKSWQERARRLGDGTAADVLLVLHVMVVVMLVTQQRTDFQRGFVFIYYIFFLLGFTMGTWKLARRRRWEAAQRRALAPEAQS